MDITIKEQIIRIATASLIGAIIGLERTLSRKPAGVRTHSIVCVVCTMLTIISTYGFSEFTGINKDPARLVANILTGIGFLAGSVIYTVNRDSGKSKDIKGLTTAAGVWGAAGLGIPIGLGHYQLAIITVFFMQLALRVEPLFEKFLLKFGIDIRKNDENKED